MAAPANQAAGFATHADAAADDLLARQQMRATILVSAEGNGPRYRFSEWANSADGRQRMEDAITFDLWEGG